MLVKLKTDNSHSSRNGLTVVHLAKGCREFPKWKATVTVFETWVSFYHRSPHLVPHVPASLAKICYLLHSHVLPKLYIRQ